MISFELKSPESRNAFGEKEAKLLSESISKALKAKQKFFYIKSNVPNLFCAGGNLDTYSKHKTKSEGIRLNNKIRKVLESLAKTPMVIIAIVDGDAIGGGWELALSCDVVIGTELSRFTFKQSQLGLAPGWGGGSRLVDRVGKSKAFNLLIAGKTVGPMEAAKMGLLDSLIPQSELNGFLTEFSLKIERLPHQLIRGIKQVAFGTGKREPAIFNELWFSDFHRNALKAFHQRL